ncbi:MAG TPA: ATP-grasp domain-containing protein [Pyrinomonadaceae bacterium]|nr:ATP-grasp domain-containing protein [Pyrinomonadaceae bacterium]
METRANLFQATNHATRWVAIVDAYSSGNLLAPEFNSRGFECVHIQSTPQLPAPAHGSFHAKDFRSNIVHQGQIEETLEHCQQFNLQCLIAGSETGVELADLLSERLGLRSNGSKLSACRRNKFQMVEQVSRNGLKTIPSLRTSDSKLALSWIEEVTGWPVVVKPLRSAGTDSVRVCSSASEFLTVFEANLGKRDKFGQRIDDLLIQKTIRGGEYIIDAVSCDGQHHVTNVWLIVKGVHNNADFVCEYNQLLDHDEAVKNGSVEYALNVITALGIRHGPTHTEIYRTPEGPILIECASRLHGGGFPIYSKECVGYGQVDLTADAYLDVEAFHKKAQAPYQRGKHLFIAELISDVEGPLKGLCTKQIESLPSFSSIKLSVTLGDLINQTVDAFTSPGHVVLTHADFATIWRDYNYLRSIERKGLLYQV